MQGIMSHTMLEAVVRFLLKKGDKADFKNWRPQFFVLTNTIINKARTLCPGMVLHHMVHENQTCTVSGRSIFSISLLVRDPIDIADSGDIPSSIHSLG